MAVTKNRNENNENTDYLIQTSIKIKMRDLSRFKPSECDPKHCYSFQECNNEGRNNKLEGCLTVHLPHEIMWNANLMQLGNFIDVFLARHVSDTYTHHQEH